VALTELELRQVRQWALGHGVPGKPSSTLLRPRATQPPLGPAQEGQPTACGLLLVMAKNESNTTVTSKLININTILVSCHNLCGKKTPPNKKPTFCPTNKYNNCMALHNIMTPE